MDAPDLPLTLREAGQKYLSSLDELGLRPQGLAWVFDFKEEKFALWLVWAGVEKVGPYEISKKLFKAYNLSALPAEIDPFSVFVLSPTMPMAKWLKDQYPTKARNVVEASQIGVGEVDSGVSAVFETRPEWIYRAIKKTKPVDVSKNWSRFSRAVDALAA